MIAHCKCGSNLTCKINNPAHSEVTEIDCSITKGKGHKCGKRQLRSKERKETGAKLCTMSTEAYRAEQARKKMKFGEREPPDMYSPAVLRTAKHEYISSQYIDKHPIKALQKMKRGPIGQHVIHNIGYDPFFVHFASKHQIRLWNKYSDEVPLIIDATSGVAAKIEHLEGQMSHSIFLYMAVIRSPVGQFATTQMLSERQDTVTISNWLRETIKIGANFPKQVICVSARALLTACVWTYTGYRTIEEYCNAFETLQVPDVLISIDVAHYIKIWANFLKDRNPSIKTFYLASIGQLILCREKHVAGELITALLIISFSAKDGRLEGTSALTICEEEKQKLQKLITEHTDFEELHSENDHKSDDVKSDMIIDVHDDLTNASTVWDDWIKDIERERGQRRLCRRSYNSDPPKSTCRAKTLRQVH